MKHYKQLASEQRYQISGLKKAGLKQSQIADEVGVHKSTISCELRRNKGRRGWRPKQAQELRDERRQGCTNAKRFSLNDWAEVERLIHLGMSPDQAAERLALEDRLQISHETIYQYIYTEAPWRQPVAELALPEAASQALCKRARAPWHHPEPG